MVVVVDVCRDDDDDDDDSVESNHQTIESVESSGILTWLIQHCLYRMCKRRGTVTMMMVMVMMMMMMMMMMMVMMMVVVYT